MLKEQVLVHVIITVLFVPQAVQDFNLGHKILELCKILEKFPFIVSIAVHRI